MEALGILVGMGIIVGIFIIPIVIFTLFELVRDQKRFSKQLKRLKNAGYKISKIKDNGKKVYLFTFDLFVIKFLQNEIYDISFDGGKTYVSIFQSNIGTIQEIARLQYLYNEYHTCDYRDCNMYDSTKQFVDFIIKNITLNK